MTERISHHISFILFAQKIFISCLADFCLLFEDPDDLSCDVVELEDPWPADDAIDMAEEMTALATAVAVTADRPPVREAAVTAEDMLT